MRKSPAKLPSKEEIQVGFGETVRALRDEQQLTQEQLAESSEMHVTYISQIERGLKNVSLFNIHRIAHALSVPPGELLNARGKQLARR
ncbi:helix-turn-helix domain-containing protein [Variovorax guangxiensis]|uniref:Transcriptional regulator with XRE-family HTH domain n=1 Tax=Variovorax guangxiensis TaxID=1775474 RepID=A0A840FPR0_9BURK|nr:helix-turn-helix transcriptional regulator [Variovorax guangxiensis]MBB4223923.1 transcriptional regulator with XRE-family HTH domain [Variovorax guangxiensis]